MRVCPLSKIYPEQSTITEFISHLSCPAPDPQPITPPGVLPTQAPSACSCSRSSTPNGEGSPTARPSAEKRKREKMWRSTTLTSSAIPPPRPGLGATRARRGRGGTGFDYRREGQGFEIAYVRPSSALTPVTAGLRLVAGARRAIPRRIHGVRLAFTSGARSDRSIAVRGPGVALTPVPPRPILRAGRGARPPTAARCRGATQLDAAAVLKARARADDQVTDRTGDEDVGCRAGQEPTPRYVLRSPDASAVDGFVGLPVGWRHRRRLPTPYG
jgi:hypothetical protein